MSASLGARRITKIFTAHRQREGAGFVVIRPFPSGSLKDADTDPFLMLDAFGPKLVDHRSPGAPWHPHRGFDTVTYFKRGAGAHQDSMGNKGIVEEGEVQWMRAGSGVIHDEGNPGMKPGDAPRQLMGFQLWVNLPASLKMSAPDYQQLTAETFVWRDFTLLGSKNTLVKLIAGTLASRDAGGDDGAADDAMMKSPLNDALAIPLLYADVDMKPGAECTVPIDPTFETALVFVYAGTVRVFNGDKDAAGTPVRRGDCVVYSVEAGALKLTTPDSDEYGSKEFTLPDEPTNEDLERDVQEYHGAQLLVLAGKRIGEPVARHGPFVMNTNDELQQAFEDYHNGRLATVRAKETKH